MTIVNSSGLRTLTKQLKRFVRGNVHAKQLIYVCGLKRSGLHAVSFWLLGHQANHALVNNKPWKRDGDESPMSRTMRTSPLPVLIYPGDPVSVCEGTSEKTATLPSSVDLLTVLFQSQSLWHLHAHDSWVSGVEAATIRSVLLLRDPFNWAASYMQKSQHPNDADVWPDMWKEYAQEFLGMTQYLLGAVPVNYNQWFVDQPYRQQIASQFGFEFTDQTLNVVTSHAGGSSFDQTNFNCSAQHMRIMDRWQLFRENTSYVNAFRKHPEIIEMAEHIFDLPDDLAEFAAMLKR